MKHNSTTKMMLLSLFGGSQLHLARSLPWSVVNVFHVALLEKVGFPHASQSQLQRVFWLEMGACAHFPFSELGPYLTWTCAGPVCAASFCEGRQAPVLLCLDDAVFLGLIHHSSSYNLPASSSAVARWALRGGVCWKRPIEAWVTQSLSLCMLSSCEPQH